MEDLDLASERSELERDVLVRNIRLRPGPKISHIGECHYCGEDVEFPRLFCFGGDCAEAYEIRKK